MDAIHLLTWFQSLSPEMQDTFGWAAAAFAALFLIRKIVPKLGFEKDVFFFFTRFLKNHSKDSWLAGLGLAPTAIAEVLAGLTLYPPVALASGTLKKRSRLKTEANEQKLMPYRMQKVQMDLRKNVERIEAMERELEQLKLERTQALGRAYIAESRLRKQSELRERKYSKNKEMLKKLRAADSEQ